MSDDDENTDVDVEEIPEEDSQDSGDKEIASSTSGNGNQGG